MTDNTYIQIQNASVNLSILLICSVVKCTSMAATCLDYVTFNRQFHTTLPT